MKKKQEISIRMKKNRIGGIMTESQYYDIRTIGSTGLTISLDNGKPEISRHDGKGTGIRSLCSGSWGYTSIDGEGDVRKGIADASALAEAMDRKTPRDKVTLSPQVSEKTRNDLPRIEEDPDDIALEDKIAYLKEIEKAVKQEGISGTRVVYSEGRSHIVFENSEGIRKEYEIVRTGYVVSAIASDGADIQAGYQSHHNIAGYEIFRKYDPFEAAAKAVADARELLKAKTPKGGTMKVILDPELAGVFTHEAVGHASEADLVLQGDSILFDRPGKQVAPGNVTIIDDPTLHEYGYFPFDAEGTDSGRTVLVENGIMTSFLHSRETAGKLGGEPGHARAQGYSLPHVRMSNTFIDRGDASFEEMLEDVRDGIYLIGSRGGQVNTGQGIFQFNAEKGYIVKDGKIGEAVRDVSLSGKTLEILQNISLVGKDVRLTAGYCGKFGQTVPVTDGAPHITVSKATVGGQ